MPGLTLMYVWRKFVLWEDWEKETVSYFSTWGETRRFCPTPLLSPCCHDPLPGLCDGACEAAIMAGSDELLRTLTDSHKILLEATTASLLVVGACGECCFLVFQCPRQLHPLVSWVGWPWRGVFPNVIDELSAFASLQSLESGSLVLYSMSQRGVRVMEVMDATMQCKPGVCLVPSK